MKNNELMDEILQAIEMNDSETVKSIHGKITDSNQKTKIISKAFNVENIEICEVLVTSYDDMTKLYHDILFKNLIKKNSELINLLIDKADIDYAFNDWALLKWLVYFGDNKSLEKTFNLCFVSDEMIKELIILGIEGEQENITDFLIKKLLNNKEVKEIEDINRWANESNDMKMSGKFSSHYEKLINIIKIELEKKIITDEIKTSSNLTKKDKKTKII